MYRLLVISFCLLSHAAVAGMSLGLGLTQCLFQKLTLDQRLQMKQKQVLALRFEMKLEQSLIQTLQDPLRGCLKRVPALVEKGVLEFETLRLNAKFPEIGYYVYRRKNSIGHEEQTANLEYLLAHTGGAFALPLGNLIIIDGDRIQGDALEAYATHELGELLYNEHDKATALEMTYMSRRRKLRSYVDWLAIHESRKFDNLFAVGDFAILRAFGLIDPKEIAKLKKHEVYRERWDPVEMRERVNTRYLKLNDNSDHAWLGLWPPYVIQRTSIAKENTRHLRPFIVQFVENARGRIQLLHPSTDLKRFETTLEVILRSALAEYFAHYLGPYRSHEIESYWASATKELRTLWDQKVTGLKASFADDALYFNWILAVEGNSPAVLNLPFREAAEKAKDASFEEP